MLTLQVCGNVDTVCDSINGERALIYYQSLLNVGLI